MIRWKAGVYSHVFRLETALALHHASVWSEISGVGVVVNALADSGHNANSLHAWDLAVDLDTDGDRLSSIVSLHGYLARILPPGYDVVLEQDHVHVEWDVKRKPAPATAGYQHPAPPASPP